MKIKESNDPRRGAVIKAIAGKKKPELKFRHRRDSNPGLPDTSATTD